MVVVVGSQGALEPFGRILDALPSAVPFAIIFDFHRSDGQRFTEGLLSRRAGLSVRRAIHGVAPEPGTIYLTPPESQVLVTEDGTLSVIERRIDHSWHQGVDALLRSAAEAHGERLIAVVLSGRLDGGADGARAVKARGGRVLAQDPSTAAAAAMPNGALATGCVDFALPPESLGHGLTALCASSGAAELFRVRLNAGARG